jgi:L-amino acid N-acyltransferase YncA
MEFREATLEDIDSMNELFLLAVKRREFPESIEEATEIARRGKENFSKSGFRVFVALDKGKVVAYAFYGSYEKIGNKLNVVTDNYDIKGCAFLQAFVAHPDYRRKGISRKLIDLVLKDAKEQGYKGMYCTTSKDNAASRKFQEKCGFKEILIFKDPKRRDGDTTVLFYQDI